MKLSDWLPSVFVEGDGDDIQVTTKKFSQFPTASGEGVQGVGVKDGNNVKFDLTTDSISVNPNQFRNAKGQFIGTPEELEALKNQRDVNNFLYNAISDIETGDIDLEGYATEAQLEEVDRTSQMRDEALKEQIEEWDVLNTAVHLKMEGQIIQIDQWSTEGDEKLQAQIDNIADALPESPDNILSIDIGEQVLKITGSRPVGEAGEDGKVLMWKAERGGPADPYNECKFVVPDVDVIDLEPSAIWFKQGDKVQQWYTPDPGWITNGNVVHYSATSAFGDNLIDGQPVDLWYEDPKKAPAEYFEVITKEESKADDAVLQDRIDDLPTKQYVDTGDRHLQGEIDQIALALETLLVQREHGQWKYVGFSGDTIPRNAGEFALAVDDLSASDNIITLNQEDLEGRTHGFGDVAVGDYVEVVDRDAPEAYALFVVTKAPEGSGIVNVEVTLKDGGLNIWVGETCEIRFFQVNEQDLQLDDLDARYLRKTGGNLTGGINMGTNPIMSVQYLGMTGAKAIQEGQTTRIQFNGKVTIPRVGDNKDGFVIKGSNDSNLLSAYHNSTDLDSINYTGKTGGSTNIATCGYVDSRVGASKGALLSHMERLYHKANQTDGKSFYFHNQYGAPTTGMNDFRKFKWKLPSSHYLQAMTGAGRDMGFIVISTTGGSLLYHCQVSNAQKDGLYLAFELDHDTHYGTSILGDAGWYVVQLFSCLRESQ